MVELVDGLLREAEKRVPKGGAPHHVALLALLELGAEYLASKDRVSGHQRELRDKTRELFELSRAGSAGTRE